MKCKHKFMKNNALVIDGLNCQKKKENIINGCICIALNVAIGLKKLLRRNRYG